MIARGQREREAEADAIVARLDPGDDLEVDGHLLAGPDVADGQVDHAVAVLRRHGRRVPRRKRLLVGFPDLLDGLELGRDREALRR